MQQVNKLIELRDRLLNMFVQKEQEITAALSALISGEPCIFIGPPGTAKTLLIETLSKSINASYFYYLLTRFTEPDEILGPLDINKLRQGIYERITTHKLPTSDIVFLDEIFKASSAIRNTLLDIILNKRFYDGSGYKPISLLAFYCASNEISTDSEDQAIYDRMTLRVFTRYVSDDALPELLSTGIKFEMSKTVQSIMDKQELIDFQNEVIRKLEAINNNQKLINKYLEALMELKMNNIVVSDRRKVKILKVISALSIIYNEEEVTLDTLADALRLACVHEESELRKVEQIIQKLQLSSYYAHINKILTLKAELQNHLERIKKMSDYGIENLRILSAIYKRTYAEISLLPRNPRLVPYLRDLLNLMHEAREIIRKKKSEIFGEGEAE